jgi:hypothetical protein
LLDNFLAIFVCKKSGEVSNVRVCLLLFVRGLRLGCGGGEGRRIFLQLGVESKVRSLGSCEKLVDRDHFGCRSMVVGTKRCEIIELEVGSRGRFSERGVVGGTKDDKGCQLEEGIINKKETSVRGWC